ncbi:YigZ family protein [Boudabousia marimammalium]|uniref:YigZ family protein n=1 Tax=Boudabousia marimammalium TaxID=156892 RepID=A0A1Q5PP98_9ACTO|nr:YigZ family protein [Boudabousia marimammalium]OKL49342.1 YigZ family protein [Boudabousia marimammalium]
MNTIPRNHRSRSEIAIKRSRFITSIARTDSEQQARDFIAEIRAEFPDARHHCSAYIVPQEDANDILRSSDDGEPSGTAGIPMLDVLKGENLTRITAVATRYFGGTLLGAGGLVHAYSHSVSKAIDTIPRLALSTGHLYHLTVPHTDAGKVEAGLRSAGWEVTQTTYGKEATIELACAPDEHEQLFTICASLTKGARSPEFQGTFTREVPM